MTTDHVAGWVRHLVTRGTTTEAPAPAVATLADEWDDVYRAAQAGRVTGALRQVAEERAEALGPEPVGQARDLHLSAMAIAVRLERMLLAAHVTLEAAGVAHLVLKGSAVAHLDHADPSDRDFGDADVLVPSGSVGAAVSALTDAGHRRMVPSVRPWLDEAFAKSVTFRSEALELDLHRTLTPGTFGLSLPLDRLWGMTEEVVVGDVALTALDGPARLLNTAVHLRLGSSAPHLSTHRDLLVQMDRQPVGLVAAAADELGLAVVLQAAVAQVAEAGWPAPKPYRTWAAEHHATARDVRRLEAHVAAGDDFGVRTRSLLGDIPWLDRPRVLAAFALPSRDNLEARGLTRRQHLTRTWSRRR